MRLSRSTAPRRRARRPRPAALPRPLEIGAAAPPISRSTTLDGKAFSLAEAARGHKAVVVMFIATKCPYSNAYNDRMRDLAAAYEKQGVLFVGINSNKTEPEDEVRAHAQEARPRVPDREGSGQQGRGPVRREAHARGLRRDAGREAALPRPHRRELRGRREGHVSRPEERARRAARRTSRSPTPRRRRSAARSSARDAAESASGRPSSARPRLVCLFFSRLAAARRRRPRLAGELDAGGLTTAPRRAARGASSSSTSGRRGACRAARSSRISSACRRTLGAARSPGHRHLDGLRRPDGRGREVPRRDEARLSPTTARRAGGDEQAFIDAVDHGWGGELPFSVLYGRRRTRRRRSSRESTSYAEYRRGDPRSADEPLGAE